jgi:cation diffusion facilitator CzcD-associated flavoprotein CzcO
MTMGEGVPVAVVGAGPFGLSVAAHLRTLGTRVFGKPMQTWRESMPPGMLLRSAWEETSLSAPGGRGSLSEWAETTGQPCVEPIPLELFLRYSKWFTEQFVGEVDEVDVERIEPAEAGFRLTTARGDTFDAERLVLAVGVMPFQHVPDELRDLLGTGVELATRSQDLEGLRDKEVAVVGGGQSALETAGLAAQAGANVELITRSEVRWFADREPSKPRSPLGQRLYRLAYPAVGYGPPPLNRLVLHPDLYAHLPASVRTRLTKRLLRPGGSPWLKELVHGRVKMREGARIREVDRSNGRLKLELDDGTRTQADRVLVAAGYRFSLDSMSFLSPSLRSRIATKDGWPVLDRCFRSVSEPRILFVGYAAEGRFGPISRYVLGTEFTANRVRECLTT